jgi:hypothetical protein
MCEDAMTVVSGGDALRDLSPDVTAIEARNLTDADLESVGETTAFERVDLSGSPEITDAGVAAVAAWPRLRWLNLMNCQEVTDEGLRALRAARRLEWLGIGGLKGITDAGLAAVCEIPTITTLLPCGCLQLGDRTLEALPRLTSLREIYTSGNSYSDEGMRHLARCRSIEVLGFDGPVGDAGYALLAEMPALRELHLPACHLLTKEGLAGLAAIPSLEELHFYNTPGITDDWVDAFGRFSSLRRLGLMGCGVSEEGLERLRAALPGCDVTA